jgi:hypothetical protein
MQSPFPGMDPFIEHIGAWEDFHHGLIGGIHDAIALRLPKRYMIRAGERSYMVLSSANGEKEYRMQPDAAITQQPGIVPSAPQGAAAVIEAAEGEAAPVTMRALVETEFREGFLEIREIHGERTLNTGIEVLSPSNKRPGTPGWEQYTRKRQEFLDGAANFVEIDLLRGGSRMPMESAWPGSPYYLLVSRKREAPTCKVWPTFSLRPLAPLPIPLAPPDADIELSLQPLIDAIYQRSQYEIDIDYRQPLIPPLSPTEAAWLEGRLRQQPG